jgi:hypothetical protein
LLAALLQATELQQYAAGQKAQQEEVRALRKSTKQHEEARSKAEVGTLAVSRSFAAKLIAPGGISSSAHTADVEPCRPASHSSLLKVACDFDAVLCGATVYVCRRCVS